MYLIKLGISFYKTKARISRVSYHPEARYAGLTYLNTLYKNKNIKSSKAKRRGSVTKNHKQTKLIVKIKSNKQIKT